MQAKTIVQTFKSYPNMPQNLQLRLLKHIESKNITTPEQIEAKLLRAQILKKQQDNAKVLRNQKHLQFVQDAYIRIIDRQTSKVQFQSQLLDNKMRQAEENAANALNERITISQKLGTQRVEQAKERKYNAVYDDNDIQKTIELSLQSMKQDKAKEARDKIQQEKIAKAKKAYTSAILNCFIDTDLTAKETYADQIREQVVAKRINGMADKIQQKQAKAEARRQKLIDDKIQKAKDSRIQYFSVKEKALNEELVMVERPSAEECAQSEAEVQNIGLEQKQKLLEEQQRILEAQLENVKKQMSMNVTQQLKATSWTICNKTFQRIKGSENDKKL